MSMRDAEPEADRAPEADSERRIDDFDSFEILGPKRVKIKLNYWKQQTLPRPYDRAKLRSDAPIAGDKSNGD